MTTQPNDLGALLDAVSDKAYNLGLATAHQRSTSGLTDSLAAAVLAVRRHVEALQAAWQASLDAAEAERDEWHIRAGELEEALIRAARPAPPTGEG